MSKPIAYEPTTGYQYQIFCKSNYQRASEHCDYAKDLTELRHLVKEYQMAYGNGFSFSWVKLPKKYHN